MNKFSLKQLLWDSFFYGNHNAPKFSARWLFSSFAQMTLVLVTGDILSRPFRWYYHWDDPLKNDNTGLEEADFGKITQSNIDNQKY